MRENMKEAVDLLKAHREKIAEGQPSHPELSQIDALIAHGQNLLRRIGHAGRESSTAEEQLVLRDRFTDEEKERLLRDGALIYLPLGETIPAQRERQKTKDKPSFWYVIEAGDRLLALPSKQVEIAIYPDPKRFFVPESFNKNLRRQEELVAKDAADLRKRLGLEGISEIIPSEAATLTDITFQHLDATGIWLFGREFASANGLDWVYGRTKNPTNSAGSVVAYVGNADPDGGLSVDDWSRGRGDHFVGAVCLVVPIENR